MEILSKIIRRIASIPMLGGYFVLLVGFLPIIALLPFGLSNGLLLLIGGVLVALWCFFLSAKNIINIVTPVIPIPNWVLGVIMAIAGVYGMVTNKWDESNTDPEVVREEVRPSKSVPTAPLEPELESDIQLKPGTISKPDAAKLNKQMLEQANSVDFNKMKDEVSEKTLESLEGALVGMQQAQTDMQELAKSIGKEKFDEMIGNQLGSDYSKNIEQEMDRIRKQIVELKSQGYGAGGVE